jgi:WD40 repeat protein
MHPEPMATTWHDAPVLSVTLSLDGSRAASLDAAGALRIWLGNADVLILPRRCPDGRIAFNRDGSELIVGDAEGGIHGFDVASGDERWSQRRHRGSVRGVAALPTGEIVSVGVDGRLYAGPPGLAKARLIVKRARPFTSLATSPSGDVAVASEAASLSAWRFDGPTAVEQWTTRSSSAACKSVFFLDDGARLLTTRAENEMHWEIKDKTSGPSSVIVEGARAGKPFPFVVAASDPASQRYAIGRDRDVRIKELSSVAAPHIEGSTRDARVASIRENIQQTHAAQPLVLRV